MNDNTQNFIKQLQEERMELSIRKNNDYSGAGKIDNIELGGINGIAIRLFDKACRIMALTINNTKRKVLNETIEDTLKDIANYAEYGVLIRRGQWEVPEEKRK